MLEKKKLLLSAVAGAAIATAYTAPVDAKVTLMADEPSGWSFSVDGMLMHSMYTLLVLLTQTLVVTITRIEYQLVITHVYKLVFYHQNLVLVYKVQLQTVFN